MSARTSAEYNSFPTIEIDWSLGEENTIKFRKHHFFDINDINRSYYATTMEYVARRRVDILPNCWNVFTYPFKLTSSAESTILRYGSPALDQLKVYYRISIVVRGNTTYVGLYLTEPTQERLTIHSNKIFCIVSNHGFIADAVELLQ